MPYLISYGCRATWHTYLDHNKLLISLILQIKPLICWISLFSYVLAADGTSNRISSDKAKHCKLFHQISRSNWPTVVKLGHDQRVYVCRYIVGTWNGVKMFKELCLKACLESKHWNEVNLLSRDFKENGGLQNVQHGPKNDSFGPLIGLSLLKTRQEFSRIGIDLF